MSPYEWAVISVNTNLTLLIDLCQAAAENKHNWKLPILKSGGASCYDKDKTSRRAIIFSPWLRHLFSFSKQKRSSSTTHFCKIYFKANRIKLKEWNIVLNLSPLLFFINFKAKKCVTWWLNGPFCFRHKILE